MNRKAIALAIVLLIAGLAPASAIIGFCTRMPCCSHAPSDNLATFSTDGTDCCTTITCHPSPSAKLATRAVSVDVAFAAPALLPVATVSSASVTSREVADTSPPVTVRQRLAALSTLLI